MIAARLLVACLVPSLLTAQLAVNKPVEATVEGGGTDKYSLDLHAGDVVTAKLEDAGVELIATVTNPTGGFERAYSTALEETSPFYFRASQTGAWNIVIAARAKNARARYTLTVLGISGPPTVAAPRDPDESPRIRRVKTQDDAAAFWREIGPNGSPLIEDSLVTFLWRGGDETKSVLVTYSPCMRDNPEHCLMSRVAGTDLWYKTFRVDPRARTYYTLIPNPPTFTKRTFSDSAIQAVLAAADQRDPLNAKTIFDDPRDPDAPIHRGASILEMPNAPPQPWIQKHADVPAGKIDSTRFESALLKNPRTIYVYTPPGYSPTGGPYGLVVVFDGETYIRVVPTPVILDNLIAAKRIPPVVAVMVGNVARSTELPCNPTFADFLSEELVPWLRRTYNVTSDPRDVTIGGSSYGGLAATYAAYRHPETFGNVLSQSGSYWWTPPPDPKKPDQFAPNADPSYVAQLFVASPKLPVRFYLDAGSMELDLSGKGGSILVPNRHLRDVLRAKGYEVFYQEFIGGHDYVSWRETLADGLVLLMGDAPKTLH